MAVAIVSVLVMVFAMAVARGVVIGVSAFMVVMIVGMETRDRHILRRVPMQCGRSRPRELERNDEHDDQCDEAAHDDAFYINERVHQGLVDTGNGSDAAPH